MAFFLIFRHVNCPEVCETKEIPKKSQKSIMTLFFKIKTFFLKKKTKMVIQKCYLRPMMGYLRNLMNEEHVDCFDETSVFLHDS